MAKARIKGVLTSLTSRRAVYTMEGYVENPEDLKFKLCFYDYDRRKSLKPTVIEWDGLKFKLYFNIETANKENPVATGNYYLVAMDEEKKKYTFHMTEELKAKRSADRWCEDVNITKSIHQYLLGTSRLDLDTDEFYIAVDTLLPEIRKNYIRRQLGEWYWGIRLDIKDFAEKAYSATFAVFNKFSRKKGNTILFASGSRASLSGNEEFIYNKMVERGLDKKYKIIFDFKPSIAKRYGPFKMLRFIHRLASADIILIDDYYPEIYKCNYDKNVKIFQVWHACGAFKSLGLERGNKPGSPNINSVTHKCYTHVPVSSYHSALHHAEAFGIDFSKFYPVGIPRTDIFFDEAYKKDVVKRMYEVFPRAKEAKRVIMYAPTFRGNNAIDAGFPMDKFDLNAWGELCKRTNSYLIVKMHPFVRKKVEIPEAYKDYIVDAAGYREVNDLLFITDVLITDYSSIIYEFSLLRRPMLFYAFDQKMYESTRDFYEPYQDIVPGRIIKDFDELLEALEKEEYDIEKLDWFIKKNFTYTDGKATDRVVDLIVGK